MILQALFPSSLPSYVVFKPLDELPNPLLYAIRCELVPSDDPAALKVTDAATKRMSWIKLNPEDALKAFDATPWTAKVTPLIQNPEKLQALILATHRITDQVSRAASIVEKQLSDSERFIPPDKVKLVGAMIAITHVLRGLGEITRPHFSTKELELPVGFTETPEGEIFLNIKGTPLLGKGVDQRYKKCVRLVPGGAQIVAKGISPVDNWSDEGLVSTVKRIRFFANKPGIIHTYASVKYKEKLVFYQPLFDVTLKQRLKAPKTFPLKLEEKLVLCKHLLQGAAKISKHGIHGEITPQNVMLKRTKNGIQGTIIDLGYFEFYNDLSHNKCISLYSSPEFDATGRRLRIDAWMMGLILYSIFTEQTLPWLKNTPDPILGWPRGLLPQVLKDKKKILASYPHWIQFPPEVPACIASLISQMLHPDWKLRFTAKEALEFFLTQGKRLLRGVS